MYFVIVMAQNIFRKICALKLEKTELSGQDHEIEKKPAWNVEDPGIDTCNDKNNSNSQQVS